MGKSKGCRECGAELRLGLASCPLCGASTAASETTSSTRSWRAVSGIDDYQANVRELRKRLKKLRDEEAKGA